VHVIDLGTYEPGRDPVTDLEIIEGELAAHGGLEDRPRLVAPRHDSVEARVDGVEACQASLRHGQRHLQLAGSGAKTGTAGGQRSWGSKPSCHAMGQINHASGVQRRTGGGGTGT